MRAVFPQASVVWEVQSTIPALSTSDENLIQLAQELSDTSGTGCVSFGTEGRTIREYRHTIGCLWSGIY